MVPAGGSSSPIPDPIKLTLAQVKSPHPNDAVGFEKMQADVANVRRSFDSVERTLPGFTWIFLRGFMERFGLKDCVDIEEMSLRLSALDNEIPMYTSIVPHTYDLEKYAAELKLVLSRIPSEISSRNEFIDLIKQIAGAIKNFLDCIRSVISAMSQGVISQDLDGHTVNFVDYSKRFSSALKGFFRDHKTNELYASANMLVQQTNLILLFIRNTR
ncbi:Programmed cell death protein 10 [Echinococcus granulosus]|uniref:Programmed cell death protein n=1 Tax=Echinococcus granulosus TaxID=6210 RepID=U6JCD7_ECHGR|nr:Programmed cell death protein [Echinococcus granulosus]EUB61064.1 Programmed cell death protein [Echinococcus granulosus]KAH9284060.1 Programmed cell death protein 10 [Echinococcus granulosus]CDS21714.1 Programmed cell death protein 10 [Echinococcus granulosus]